MSVSYATQNGSAIAGTDYTAESGSLNFAPGSSGPNFVNIPILDDGNDETVGSEWFTVYLYNPQNASLGADSTVTVNIEEGPQQGSTDTLIWNPCPNGSYNASDSANWYDETLQAQLTAGQPGPGPGTPIIFDGTATSQTPYDYSPITWDQSSTVASITLDQYTNVQTVDATLETSGYGDEDIGVSNFVVAFAAGADLNFKRGQDDVMGNFNWQAGGKVTVNGANIIIGQGPGLNQSTGSPLIINSGSVSIGTSNGVGGIAGSSTFKLTNGSADINVNPNGTLKIYTPGFQDTTMVDNTGTSAWIANYGTTQLVKLGGWTGTIAAPFENHGTFSAIDGEWKFTRADANGNDLSMDVGKISMAKSVYLRLNDNYTQTGGTLEIADNTSCHLYATGQDNFDGGKIVFDSPSGFGKLYVYSVVFTGVEIDMRIDPGSTTSDLISCLGGNKCVIQGTSKLVVTAANAVNPKLTWTLIKPNMGQTITGDFQAANITLPNNVKETAGALPNSWQCNS